MVNESHSVWRFLAKEKLTFVLLTDDQMASIITYSKIVHNLLKKVQVGKDQEKAQSEKDSHSKNRGGNIVVGVSCLIYL